MLTALRIKDFAIIDDLAVSLQPGFNVLSGETGAGKSIVVGALGLLLGERAHAEDVRSGSERAVIEGTFDISSAPAVVTMLKEQGLSSDDDSVVLRREIQSSGRGRAWVNGFATNVSVLAEIGLRLTAIHGQHEAQSLLDASSQRSVLDDYAGAGEDVARVANLHIRLRQMERDIRELNAQQSAREKRRLELEAIVREIRTVAPVEGEEESLDDEAKRLEHAVELAQLAEESLAVLQSDDSGVADALKKVRRHIDALVKIDNKARGMSDSIESAEVVITELIRDLADYAGRIEVDPERLARVNERRSAIFKLTRKYPPGITSVLAVLAGAESELRSVTSQSAELGELQNALDSARRDFAGEVAALTQLRTTAAEKFSASVSRLLQSLGMEGANFRVSIVAAEEPDSTGGDIVQFRVQINVGHEERELSRVASGGELSRIMLAIKTVLARLDKTPTLIFDEVDAGIGGETALHVGNALRQLSEHHQILVITHLPQIAARAHNHLIVRKSERKGAVTADVTAVVGDDRVGEIARMLSGDARSKSGRAHAAELLDSR